MGSCLGAPNSLGFVNYLGKLFLVILQVIFYQDIDFKVFFVF